MGQVCETNIIYFSFTDEQLLSNNLPSSRENSHINLAKEPDTGGDSETRKARQPENTQVQQTENPPKTRKFYYVLMSCK